MLIEKGASLYTQNKQKKTPRDCLPTGIDATLWLAIDGALGAG